MNEPSRRFPTDGPPASSARDIVGLWPSYAYMSRWALDILQWGKSEGGEEALLAQLRDAQRMQVEAQLRRRLLIAYMRERLPASRRVSLQRIAQVAGMSISGVRTAYNNDDIQVLDELLVELAEGDKP
jgi:hypothetical protein